MRRARAGTPTTRQWRGSVRNRLLWMLLAETGVRLGEALGLQHRDWHTGRGDTPFIEVVARDHPHGVRAKSGYRRLYVSDELDRLYGEYVWQLCEAGADLATDDFDAAYVFVNLDRDRGSRRGDRSRSMTWWTGCAADCPGRCRRPGRRTGCGTRTPQRCCCRGCRCTWCSRRLGHVDVQTTLNTYAHVTEDAEMRAVADWKAFTAGWRIGAHGASRSGPARDRPAPSGDGLGEAAGGRCDAGVLERLWAAVPPEMRLSRFRRSRFPPQYAGAFCHEGPGGPGSTCRGCRSRCAGSWPGACSASSSWAGRSRSRHLSMLVRRLGEVIADRAAGRPPP